MRSLLKRLVQVVTRLRSFRLRRPDDISSRIRLLKRDETVYRLAGHKTWLDKDDNRRFTPLAFELRPTRQKLQREGRQPHDIGPDEIENYLSVFIARLCTLNGKQIEGVDYTSFGVAQVIVGAIRDLSDATFDIRLDVEYEPPPPPSHAGITGIPHWTIDDDKAERIADLLAQHFERIA